MKKQLSQLLISLFFAGSLFGQSADDSCLPDPCCEPCPPKDPCAKCAQLWPTCGPDWIITPNAGPCVSCGADLFISAEYLYWAARQDRLGFALLNDVTSGPSEPASNKGKVVQPNWRQSSGFKVALGIMFDCDGWDFLANYTWLRPRTRKRVATPTGALSLSELNWNITSDSSAFGSITRIAGKWELDFNVVDVELGRNFFISKCLHLRPHFGLKGTWQEQKMDVSTTAFSSSQEHQLSGRFDLDYWGIGIRTGLDTAWHLSPCLSFVGEVAVTNLWERFESTGKSVDENIVTGLFFVPFNICDSFHTIKPVLETYFGLRWENWFCCDEFHWSVEAAWEQQWWADQNQFYYGRAETRMGDLGLQGLTVKVRFDF